MLSKDAYTKLKEHKNKLISEIYDKYSEEILTIKPNFEYPDWSFKTVSDFLSHCDFCQ